MTRRELRGRDPGGDRAGAAGGEAGSVRGAVRAILTGVVWAVLLAILGVGAAAIVVPAVTGSVALTVMTSSMEPHYPAGTLVVIRPTPVAEIVPGDVITYQLHSGEAAVVTHRVTQRLQSSAGEPLFITQGDANPTADPEPVRGVQVRGVLWYAIPYVGWVSSLVTGDVRAVVVPVVVGALLIYAVWMFATAARDRRRNRAARSEVSGTMEK
ncbi:signal peptidase I [Microbacterium gorillae]|uniref:signal peptidase I n=1 Tax=Microbacterium gorillae TaxID=1231063 RepID=UPI0006948E39|nr:signal peptidase I [Microbacterium gorillae]